MVRSPSSRRVLSTSHQAETTLAIVHVRSERRAICGERRYHSHWAYSPNSSGTSSTVKAPANGRSPRAPEETLPSLQVTFPSLTPIPPSYRMRRTSRIRAKKMKLSIDSNCLLPEYPIFSPRPVGRGRPVRRDRYLEGNEKSSSRLLVSLDGQIGRECFGRTLGG